jgi:hypothetical protein
MARSAIRIDRTLVRLRAGETRRCGTCLFYCAFHSVWIGHALELSLRAGYGGLFPIQFPRCHNATTSALFFVTCVSSMLTPPIEHDFPQTSFLGGRDAEQGGGEWCGRGAFLSCRVWGHLGALTRYSGFASPEEGSSAGSWRRGARTGRRASLFSSQDSQRWALRCARLRER